MAIPGVSVEAGGNINTSRFVKLDTGNDETILEGSANCQCFGISQEGSNYPPLSGQSVSAYAAQANEQCGVFQPGEHCLLVAGDTVTRGDRLKSDANGKGVPIASTGTTIQHYGAVALQSGSANEKIKVRVQVGSERPALA